MESPPAAYVPRDRKPRHVLQKAREIFLRVETLERLKGIGGGDVHDFPVRKVSPKHVREIVERVLADVRGLRPAFGIDIPPAAAAYVPGKVPTDVYGNLAEIGNMLESLGVPPLEPKDPYRLVLALIHDLESIASQRRKTCDLDDRVEASDKEPKDVYALAYRFLEKLARMIEGLGVGGGLVLVPPQRKKGRIVVPDVADLLNNVLADVGALKQALAVTQPTVIGPVHRRRVPSDVYSALVDAESLLDCLW